MPSVLIVFSNSSILEEKIQCLIQNPGNDPVASVASGFCPMFGKPVLIFGMNYRRISDYFDQQEPIVDLINKRLVEITGPGLFAGSGIH